MKLYEYGKISIKLQADLEKIMVDYRHNIITEKEADHRASVAMLHFKNVY